MSVAVKVKEFIETCPFLKEFEQATFPVVNMDVLEDQPTMYSIEETPADPIIKRYANGDSVRQYVFSLCSRELYGPAENEDTAKFYEKFSDWLEDCTREGILPVLSGQLQSKSIRATTNGYLYDNEGTSCQYRIRKSCNRNRFGFVGDRKRVKKYRKINEGSSGNSCGRISETGDECERCIQKSVE